jgi:pSer/pThr/pTyr-binding forkhead associated (FHA) protein
MKVVLVMFHEQERREFPLTGQKSIIGRRQECHLRIPTGDVSRQHCVVVLRGDMLHVTDLGSANGTYVNGTRIAETELKAGDRLRVGPVTFVVQIDGRPADIKPEQAGPPTAVAPTAAAAAPAAAGAEAETFELGDEDFDLDDPISALEDMAKDDDDDLP